MKVSGITILLVAAGIFFTVSARAQEHTLEELNGHLFKLCQLKSNYDTSIVAESELKVAANTSIPKRTEDKSFRENPQEGNKKPSKPEQRDQTDGSDLVTITSIFSIILSFLTLIVLLFHSMMLRKSIISQSFHALLDKIFSARDTIIDHDDIASIFTDSNIIKSDLDSAGITVKQFFFILKYITAWENVYYQRKIGAIDKHVWHACNRAIYVVFQIPKIKKLWEQFRIHKTYTQDFTTYINKVIAGEQTIDPILPFRSRIRESI